jgi:4-hydroxythreonine-4-phosphate dehydrogenase
MTLVRLALTAGEPAGIGPDLCLMIARQALPCEWVVIGDPDLLAQRAEHLGLNIRITPWAPGQTAAQPSGCMRVWPVARAAATTPGQLNPANAGYVLSTLTEATRACQRGQFGALVTCPVHKGIINTAGTRFSGHTEYIAHLTGGEPVMLLTAPGLRVALATTHLPLTAVSQAITREGLEQTLRILDHDLRIRFGIPAPRILVAGLNPHAGEGGHLGREEIEIIEPVLAALCEAGLNVIGPLPADTLFLPSVLAGADAVLAMYHDQGLPVLKHLGFGRAVNITLGLPIIRTSVDHGTALELAGTGRADTGSLLAAIDAAMAMIQRSPAIPLPRPYP